jgi:signal transduction histidine kinase
MKDGRREWEKMEESKSRTFRQQVVHFLDWQPRWCLWLEAMGLSFVIGFIDFATGYEVSMVIIYLAPILLLAWFGNRVSGVLMALWCTMIWWWADEAAGHHYVNRWHQVWETFVILGYFAVFVEAATAMKARIALLEHLRRLELEIIRISEREQRRIGQDLHDGICQFYAAVGCAAGSLKLALEKQGLPTAKAAADIEELIMKGVGQTRTIARGLSPVEEEARGLQYALEELVYNTGKLLGITCELDRDKEVSIYDPTRANHLYRIAQEAISNATRHGKAGRIDVRLHHEDSVVTLCVEDNGCGIRYPLPEPRGLGLSIMQYRARMIGGKLEVAPRERGGTIVTCTFHQPELEPTDHDESCRN